MFSIEFDASRALVRAKVWGFMTPDEVTEFFRQEHEAVVAMGSRSGEFLLLINTEGAVIQSQEVIAAFMDIMARSPLKARRIAVVRGASLTRMQTQRILMIRDHAAIFSTLPEAEEWLFAAVDGAAVDGNAGPARSGGAFQGGAGPFADARRTIRPSLRR